MPIPTIVAALSALCLAQPGGGDVVNDDPKAEGKFLGEIRQLTFAKDFVKAGESYFSHDGKLIVFQGVPVPPEGEEPSTHYGMYLTANPSKEDETWFEENFKTTIPEWYELVSPAGSANTCGWFHPSDNYLIFGSTLVPPSEDNQPGYQRGSGRYRWAFPTEMEIAFVELQRSTLSNLNRVVTRVAATSPKVGFQKPGYTAECSYSPDGRYILYAQIDQAKSDALGAPDADLWVYDTESKEHTILVEADGYDGGPFFSPDAKWICYRSDRRGDNLLQLFVAELAYDESGRITGISREIQITDNQDVNWAPFWHPSGEFMVYASSQVSHGNYEVFAIPFDANDPEKKQEPIRITYASGFDGLPVFSADGEWMMWTAQRGEDRSPDGKASSQLWIAKWKGLSGGE